MTREILFRGKKLSTGEWVQGYFFKMTLCDGLGECCYIKFDGNEGLKVIPETVGQYTGMKDKNHTMIFEGDILNVYTLKHSRGFAKEAIRCEMVFKNGSFYPEAIDKSYRWGLTTEDCEVIGNVHDNPEMLNV